MLHLENFFEKSFALLLTTPRSQDSKNNDLTFFNHIVILCVSALRRTSTDKGNQQRVAGR